jgi:hypothetical protein
MQCVNCMKKPKKTEILKTNDQVKIEFNLTLCSFG